MNIFEAHPAISMFIVMMLVSFLRQNKETKR